MLTRTPQHRGNERIVSVLDIGTNKICCFIVALAPWARQQPAAGRAIPARLIGAGYQRSKGIKAGFVDDLDEAEEAVRACVSQAERSAGNAVDEVILSVSCGRIKSDNFAATADVNGAVVSEGDLERVLAAGQSYAEQDGRSLLHLHRLGYRLDGQGGIRNPKGMSGQQLSVDLHAVTADETPLRNLLLLIERCYLNVAGLVATPYASGLSVISEDEAKLGVTCIDIGAGTTTLSVFAEDLFLHTDGVAIGGNHISYDLANALSTPLYEAERIKTYHGNLIGAASDEHEIVPYTVVGENEVGQYQTTRAHVRNIVRPRIEQILDLIGERLDASGFADVAGERIVLTGGASEMSGLGAFAARHLGRAVRIGQPRPIAGMPESMANPAFASAIGLVHSLFVPGAAMLAYEDRRALQTGTGYLARVGRWFRQSFWDE